MSKFINYCIPVWFPCFMSTLIAFALSIKPAMSLSTLPLESGLCFVPPSFAVLTFTIMGFTWGLVITLLLKRNATATHEAERRAAPR